jgi:hypothetical protein
MYSVYINADIKVRLLDIVKLSYQVIYNNIND